MRRAGTRFDLAVFPLHDAVLFPGTSLPLPLEQASSPEGAERNKQMLADVQARNWPLAVTLVMGSRPSGGGEVRLSSICSAGQLEMIEGSAVVHGTSRIRLLKVVQQHPYLIMEAETVPGDEEASLERSREHLRRKRFEEFKNLIKTWAFVHPRIPDELSLLWDEFDNLAELTDFFVFHFVEGAQEKQAYLTCIDPFKRATMLARYLERDLIRQNRKMKRELRSHLLH
jgi:Lon protease-like protein